MDFLIYKMDNSLKTIAITILAIKGLPLIRSNTGCKRVYK